VSDYVLLISITAVHSLTVMKVGEE